MGQARAGSAGAALLVLVELTLVATTAYQSAFALGAFSVGSVPGEGPPLDGAVLAAAVAALLVGALAAPLYLLIAPPLDTLTALLAPLGTAYVIARFYGYDPYYAPTLRRFSDQGAVSAYWILALAVAAIVAAILTRLRPPVGIGASAVLLVLCAGTALFAGAGH